MPSIIRKTTSSPCVRTSNIITNTRRILYIRHIASTARTVAPDGYRRGRWTPKGRNHHRITAPVRSLKNLPGILEPALQRNHVPTDVLVLLADMVTYHLRGSGSLGTVTGPRDRHQTRIGSTTGWLLTKLRPPEGSASQYHPGGAQSRTWPIWSSRCRPPPTRRRGCGIGIVHVDAGIIALTKKKLV